MKTTKFALLVSLLACAGLAAAQTADPKVNERQQNQQQRIEQGVQSGELTKREAVKLEAREAKIAREERRMKADGELTKKERAKLHKDLNKTSKAIYKQKHDAQKR